MEKQIEEKSAGNKIQELTTKFFVWYKKRRQEKAEKQKKKHPVLEWIEAIVWALIIVLLIQQFVFELYVIPTGSMLPYIDIGARVAVEKITYGPELIPGKIKFNGIRGPKRGEIVMFENPSYPPMPPLKNILHKIIYRVTLTFVDIDKDESGNPRPRLLLKRVIGIPGDKIRTVDGDVEIMPAGTTQWLSEEELKKQLGIEYEIRREYRSFSVGNNKEWEIPENTFFPMGDNRDNSRDAREYGPVPTRRLLGRAFFRFWPMQKFGIIP